MYKLSIHMDGTPPVSGLHFFSLLEVALGGAATDDVRDVGLVLEDFHKLVLGLVDAVCDDFAPLDISLKGVSDKKL